MKKQLRYGLALLTFLFGSFSANAQNYVPYVLDFPNPVHAEHEYGFSTVQYNGYSVSGTEANQTINVHKDDFLLFQATKVTNPIYSCGFGHSVGMNADWLAVGANKDDQTPTDNSTTNHGRVYMSKNLNGIPQNNFNVIINPQIPTANDQFGESLDLDGQWMVIGAPGYSGESTTTGYIEIWKQTATGWERKQRIKPTDIAIGSKFGFSVAIKGDYIVVGAPKAQKIYVYKNTNSVWAQLTTYTPPNMGTWAGARNYDSYTNSYHSIFGHDVDVHDGKIIVGDPNWVQKAAIYTISGNSLVLTKELIPPGYSLTNFTNYGDFGQSVALETNVAVVGAPTQYGPDITYKQDQGKVFFYADNYQEKGYMHVDSIPGKKISGLGRSVSLNGANVLVGAEYTDNMNDGVFIEGAIFRMPFNYINLTGNTPPTISITSPTVNNNIFTAPAAVTITAQAADPNGNIFRVEFYNGTTYISTDITAPYTCSLTNLAVGNYNIIAVAMDNQGSVVNANVSFSVVPASDISGPTCVNKNTSTVYELSAAKRTNATGFNWYYSGTTQSIIPVSGTPYKANLTSGNNFTAGQLCVGVNYSSAPYYVSYCLNVTNCQALRIGDVDMDVAPENNSLVNFPNPFKSETTINLANATTSAEIQILDAIGVLVMNAKAQGSFTFGSDLKPGLYFVKIITSEKTQVLRVIKE